MASPILVTGGTGTPGAAGRPAAAGRLRRAGAQPAQPQGAEGSKEGQAGVSRS